MATDGRAEATVSDRHERPQPVRSRWPVGELEGPRDRRDHRELHHHRRAPNELVRPIHDRMPLIIDPADHDRWLNSPEPPTDLLRPYPAEAMAAFPVSTLVNSPKNEDAQ